MASQSEALSQLMGFFKTSDGEATGFRFQHHGGTGTRTKTLHSPQQHANKPSVPATKPNGRAAEHEEELSYSRF
jgi:hypothetical protein